MITETQTCWICLEAIVDPTWGTRKDGECAHNLCLLIAWYTGKPPSTEVERLEATNADLLAALEGIEQDAALVRAHARSTAAVRALHKIEVKARKARERAKEE